MDSCHYNKMCVYLGKMCMYVKHVVPLFLRSVSKRCPAIMFAVNRTARVPGRIMFLTVSIHTINGISAAGVPCKMFKCVICVVDSSKYYES
jgi:hypothetical protein